MTLIVSAEIDVIPKHDVILPLLTSKVAKFILSKNQQIGELIGSKKKYKELSISPLSSNGRFLYAENDGKLLRAMRGEKLHFTFSVATSEVNEKTFDLDGDVSTSYGEFYVLLKTIYINQLKDIRHEIKERNVNLRFESPTLLSNKYMVPPVFKKKKVRSMNRLIPQPSLIFSFLANLWNSIADERERIVKGDLEWTPYYIGRIADVAFAEIGYSLRPVTVIIGKDNNQRIRQARGFVGWVKYEVINVNPRYLETFERLLGLAKIFGIGRSRGIGLGRVKVE
ncbi:CRISPR system precrRNA processing endoribonuclease RAMP protein Cas6 [Sulfolobus acidocaldarius]|uniref:Conserved protein n=4 Tax=Sulfolobus acidocaldarius TaxID=2285 RepID=Q4J7R1_SULAC|nr:CRISPR system precrRNA processing endoribonuclease RAMP protein Cas6 [Sulfolobus acidocaldarius]AAY81170.1 conserved protein [Sulfolobus acidocaldarius DSM 639]AGE71783.1 hypothetical protein SacN8_09115 [Sulfolobus acidocaldarius N8]AGE74055.1 hypothetical protein SacRon12I_09140 [Sulfolobus acidocaldarius Ron12/I]ALU30021.1 hypothetical protein ATY89_08790 [Sulfolobus acidocaldarius]ALU30711.1 hypothetical protein ATZ20_00200 [Sulfolobus acidocaldarius]